VRLENKNTFFYIEKPLYPTSTPALEVRGLAPELKNARNPPNYQIFKTMGLLL
jgi:hypothetical protein